MFPAYLGPSSGGTTICIQKFVLIILFRRLFLVLFGLEQLVLITVWVLFGLEQLVLITVWVLVGLELRSNPTRTTDNHLKRIISTNCRIHTVVPPDDGPRYGRNM